MNPLPLTVSPEFRMALGTFHGAWCSLDMIVDFAIGKLLNLKPEQTHLMTAGMLYGAKFRLLAELLRRSDHPRKSELLGALNKVRNNAKREVITHAYLQASADRVWFLTRTRGGEYKASALGFGYQEFVDHVEIFTQAGTDFEKALGVTQDELREFWEAAVRANQRDQTSPADPDIIA